MFRNNRNKQKTNRNSSKFVKISTCLIPHTIRSVCFGCFDTGPKHQNKPKKMFLGFAKQTEKQPKQIEFWFVLVRTEKKFDCFEGTLAAPHWKRTQIYLAGIPPLPFYTSLQVLLTQYVLESGYGLRGQFRLFSRRYNVW
jgi:hypothetical protein